MQIDKSMIETNKLVAVSTSTKHVSVAVFDGAHLGCPNVTTKFDWGLPLSGMVI